MKLVIATLFLAAVANAQIDNAQLEFCTDCLEDIDDSRDCLRQCNNVAYQNNAGEDVSLLAECLTEDGDFGNVQTLGDVVDCCGLDGSCEQDLFDVQSCIGSCLDSCIKDDAFLYLECIRRETGDNGCELTACLDGFLSDETEDDINLAGSEDVFDLRSISNTVSGIEEDDVGDCELLRDFIETSCDLGRSCCDRCDAELGAVVGCLVNDIVIPFVAIETNTTIDTCPIDEATCRLLIPNTRKANEVTAEEAEIFNRALSLPRGETAEISAKREAIVAAAAKRRAEEMTVDEEVAVCEEKMRLDMIASNMTHATNKYMECITAAAIMSLEDPVTDESSVAQVAKFVALAFSFVGALLF